MMRLSNSSRYSRAGGSPWTRRIWSSTFSSPWLPAFARMTFLVLFAVGATSASAAPKQPKIPKDAPFCPAPGAKLVFIAPSGEPFRAAQGEVYPVAVWFMRADADHDGRMALAEFLADADRFFSRLDADKDGQLIPEELTAYERDIAPEIAIYQQRPDRPAKRSSKPDTRYGGAMGAGRYGLLNIPHPVASADADYNRGIDRTEYAAAAKRWFAQLDTARAGALILANLPATPAQTLASLPCRPIPPRPEGASR